MGDTRYQAPYRHLVEASDRAAAMRTLADDEVIMALAAASRENNPLLANVLATEAMNRIWRSRTLAEHLPDGAFAVDEEERFTFVNPAMLRRLGGDLATYVGAEMPEVVRMRDEGGSVVTGTPACPVRSTIRDAATREVRGEIERIGGPAVPATFVIAPILRNGHAEGAVVAFRAESAAPEEDRDRRLLEVVLAQSRSSIVIAQAPSGRMLYLNERARAMFGREPVDGERIPLVRALQGEEIVGEEIEHVPPTGGRVILDVRAAPVRGANGEIVAAVAVYDEVTSERQREVEVARLATIVEQTHDAILAIDAQGRITDANPAAQRLFGFEHGALRGLDALELVPEEEREGAIEWRMRILRGEGIKDMPVTRLRRDGSRVDLTLTASALRENGKLVGVALIFRDDTERKRVTEELARREEQYRQLVLRSPEPIAVHAGGKLLFINPAGATLLGASDPAELVGRDVRDFVHPESHAFVSDRLKAVMTSSTPLPPAEEKLLRVDGRTVVVETVAIPTEYEGKPAVQLIIRDVSHRKMAEDDLARRVRERTLQLEQALRDLRTFTDSASHDLRAPLRGIEAYAHDLRLALHENDLAEGRELASRIEKENDKAQRLVRDLLDFARAGRKELVLEDVDVSALTMELLDDLRRRHPERPVNVRVQAGMRVVGDRALLSIALNNLLSNATKYAARAPKPSVEVTASDEGEGRTFHVRDNGIGFSEREASRLFQPFARLSSAASFEGTGLGLAMVHRVITRHGGRIWATSEPGRGATFSFTLGIPLG